MAEYLLDDDHPDGFIDCTPQEAVYIVEGLLNLMVSNRWLRTQDLASILEGATNRAMENPDD